MQLRLKHNTDTKKKKKTKKKQTKNQQILNSRSKFLFFTEFQSSTNSIQTDQVEEQPNWLYDYHEGKNAEESLNKEKVKSCVQRTK